MDAIELDLDERDEELVLAFAFVVRDLARERLDLTDPLTAIEADRRLAQRCPGTVVEYVATLPLTPPLWAVRREAEVANQA